MPQPLPELLVPDAASWRAWLEQHHETSPGVRLVIGKKGGTETALTWSAAVDEALCFGWIDGQAGRRNDETYVLRFAPRTARSMWSKRNVANVGRLEAEGRLHPSGLRAVDAAKNDGRWERAYAGPAETIVPEDLAAAIAAVPAAQAMFEVLTSQNRFALVSRIERLKTAAARQRNIERIVAMLAAGETPYPQRRRPDARLARPEGLEPPTF